MPLDRAPVTYGALYTYTDPFDYFFGRFQDAYEERKRTEQFPRLLLLETRDWIMTLAEAQEVIVILSFPVHIATVVKVRYASKNQHPTLPNDVDEIARFLELGEVVGYKPFPHRAVFTAFGPEYDRDAVNKLASEWGDSLAREHIARTNPTFEEAQRRMMEAYGKLFELEHFLRAWIEQTLTATIGPDWWDKAKIAKEIRGTVLRNQVDTRGAYLDDYETSILRFVEFPHLRSIIFDNESSFRPVLGNNNWLKTVLSALEPLRNRVGHVNTLSAMDVQDFFRDANRVIEAIRPHARIR